MYRFKAGDRVHIISGFAVDSYGVITECNISEVDEEYTVLIDGESMERVCFRENIEPENIMDCEVEPFLEMAGRLPRDKSGRCKLHVAVGADERNIAHFHVFRSETDLRAWRNGACLFFTENRYYDHSHNTETLTKDELKDLVNVLNQPYKRNKSITNWQQLVYLWNDNNDRYEIPDDTPMPKYDYKTILRYKEKDFTEEIESEDGDIMDMEVDDEPFFEMATITRDRDNGILISVNPEREHLNIPYFKAYDSASVDTAKRVIGLHFKDSGMEYHRDPIGKSIWSPNAGDKKNIIKLLNKPSRTHKPYTNWQVACYQWNYENNLIDDDIDAYMSGQFDEEYENINDSRLKEAYVPHDQEMPEEWTYDPPKGKNRK